jgi:sodium/potassium/calcium exchanger 6
MAKVERPQLVHRLIQMDPKRHRFHNKAALILTMATCVLLMTLSVIFGQTQTTGTGTNNSRFLEDNNQNDDDESSSDFSSYSCRYIYDQVPEPGYAQCRFARTCNGGEGVWAPWVFCYYNQASVATLFLLLSPIMIIWMVTLFRLLGSTAEDYFSPSLEMFSVKLGLPPRFAGVSLLALGNGAADVSATMSAIVSDQENGYKLSLGALTGAAMLVGGLVSGMVVLVAGGVPCRGALVRDVTALCITIVVVWYNLSKGEIGPATITLFLSMYAVFVCLVLVADVYHRAVVLPRLAAQADDSERQRQWNAEEQVHEQVGAAVEHDASSQHSQSQPHPGPPSALTRVITAFSNYDNQDATPTITATTTNDSTGGEGWGVSSTQLQQDSPIVLHGQHGILHGDGHAAMAPDITQTNNDGGGAYALVEDHIDQLCAGDGSLETSATNWSGAWHDGKQELMAHANQVWEDVWYNGDLNAGEKCLLAFELPFTFARKVRNERILSVSVSVCTQRLALECIMLMHSFFLYYSSSSTVLGYDTHSLRRILQSRRHYSFHCAFPSLVRILYSQWTQYQSIGQGFNTLFHHFRATRHLYRRIGSSLCSRRRWTHEYGRRNTHRIVWIHLGRHMD